MIKYYLPHSTRCFICGADNEVGLKCRFYTDDSGKVFLNPLIQVRYAGFMNVVHGGVQSAILDEAMGWCGFTQTDSESLYFTRELKVKFRKNVQPMTPLIIEANIIDARRGIVYSEGTIKDDSGAVLTAATGMFVPIPAEMMRGTTNHLLFINDGRTYLEKAIRVCNPSPSDR